MSALKIAWHEQSLCPGWAQRPQRRRGVGLKDAYAISDAKASGVLTPLVGLESLLAQDP